MGDDRSASPATDIGVPTPRSNIAATYIPLHDTIMVFHSNLNVTTNVLELSAITLSKSAQAASLAPTGWERTASTIMR